MPPRVAIIAFSRGDSLHVSAAAFSAAAFSFPADSQLIIQRYQPTGPTQRYHLAQPVRRSAKHASRHTQYSLRGKYLRVFLRLKAEILVGFELNHSILRRQQHRTAVDAAVVLIAAAETAVFEIPSMDRHLVQPQ